jgi:hypothetical protein
MPQVAIGAVAGVALLGSAIFHLWPLVHEGTASVCDAAVAAEMSHPESIATLRRLHEDYRKGWMAEVVRFQRETERYLDARRIGAYALTPLPIESYYRRTPEEFMAQLRTGMADDSRQSYVSRYTYLPVITRCALAWWQIKFYA